MKFQGKFNMLVKGLAVFVVVVSAFYLWVLASDRYSAESRFTIKSQGEAAASTGFDLGLLGGSSVTKQDQLIIRDYLLSYDMMQKVVDEYGIEKLSSPRKDVLWRAGQDTKGKDLLSHYRALIQFSYDEEAGVSKVVTQGFSPEMARDLNAFLIESAEQYINDFSERSSDSFIAYAEGDVERAQERMEEVNQKIREAQDAGQLVGPETELQVVASNLTSLEATLAAERAELNRLQGIFQDDAWDVVSKERYIETLVQQVADLRSRMASDDGEDLAQASVLFASLQSELEFANTAHASALKTLEMAKMQAMQSRKHLVIIESPDLPDFPEYPRRFLWLLIMATLSAVGIVILQGISRIVGDY